jgi:hypothetical protein
MHTATDANLGLATTEQLYRELIARDSHVAPHDTLGNWRRIRRVGALSETLGGLDVSEREYRTVES